MELPSDLKERLRDVLPEKYHSCIESAGSSARNCKIIRNQLIKMGNIRLEPEMIIKSFREGSEIEKVLAPAVYALKCRKLHREIVDFWNRYGKQF